MSTGRRLLIYGSTLAVLVILYAVGYITSPARVRAKIEPLLPGFSIELVTSFRISDREREISIDRDAVGWLVEKDGERFPARTDRIDILFEELQEAQVVRSVSRDSVNHADLGVGDQGTTLRVETSADRGESVLVWGGAAPEPGLTYVRRGDGDQVYATDGRITFYLSQPQEYWSYLRVFPESLTVGEVSSVRVTGGTDEESGSRHGVFFEIERGNTDTTQWSFVAVGERLDSVKVNRFLRGVVDLVGADFAQPTERTGLSGEPVVSLEIETSSGRSYLLDVYEDGEDYIAAPSGDDLPGERFGGLRYRIEKSVVERIAPASESLSAE